MWKQTHTALKLTDSLLSYHTIAFAISVLFENVKALVKLNDWRDHMRYLVGLLICLLPLSVYADVTRNSIWLMSLSRIKFTDKVNGYIDIQPRYTVNDIPGGEDDAFDMLLMRGAIGYQITPNIGLYQGYGYIPSYDPKNVDNRFYQELFIKQPLSLGNALAHRLRLEERIIDSADETSYRFRYFGRYVHPLKQWHPKLSLAINEEIFINLNDAEQGPQSGFNQNRLFFGLNYRVNPSLAYEFGYQNQFINVTSSDNNISNHILFFGIQTKFSMLDD